jgi:serine/threonine protein kinase/formylglycine-generating enzyme required for sulfatase activity
VTAPPVDPAITGTDIDEFRLIRVLGKGGMGAVYLGHDTLLDRQVAIKLIRADAGDASDRSRFLTEARAIARLSHPNVVTIFRAGTTRGGQPYLAQELIRGQTLSALARPIAMRRACELGLGVARGLAAAHRRGILHRDVKPANVMVDDHGTARLLDFGIAKLLGTSPIAPIAPVGARPASPRSSPGFALDATADLPAATPPVAAIMVDTDPRIAARGEVLASTADGALVGTPRYMAPEIWSGETATARSDLYSLGVLLYELVAGTPPFAQADHDALGAAVVRGPAPTPVEDLVPDLDPDLAALITRCLDRNPDRRPESADEVAHALERVLTGAPPVPDGNPYPGLAPFDASHRAVFYGRGPDVSAIVDRLRAEPLVVVAGDSGAGKSSVCRAGVAPAIAGGALADGRTWEVRFVPVGRRPATALREALGLAADTPPTASALAAALAGDRTRGLLVVIDQLEELVTVADPEEADAAAELIAALAGDIPGLKLLLAVRGDFLTRVASLTALGALMTRSLHVLRLLDRGGTREAVTGPARAKGVRFGSDAMVETLVASMTADAGTLPLLQFTLAELWDRRDVDARVIPEAALDELGGVAGSLARHADGVLTALPAAERTAARRILLALVTRDGTRASRERHELVGVGDRTAETALEALVRGRLVVARDAADGAPVYTLAHESLLDAWGTLRGWLDDAAGQRGLRLRVSAAADEWHRLGRRGDLLWARAQLREAAGLDDLAERDRSFLAASARAARRRRVAAIAVAISIPVVAIATWVGFGIADRAARDREVAARVAAADRQLATAEASATAAATTRGEAFALFDGGKTEDGEARWQAAKATAAIALRAYADAAAALEAALIEGGDRPAVRARMADAIYRHALAAEAAGDGGTAAELIRRLDVYGGREQLAAWRAPATLTIDAPGARRIEVRPYVDRDGVLELEPPAAAVDAAHLVVELPPGSYAVKLTGTDGLLVDHPVLLARGERFATEVAMPAAARIPSGFVYIPAGRVLVGSTGDDDARLGYLLAPPMHSLSTSSYLIGRTEVTFADWMRYLRALSPDERARRRPPSLEGAGPFTLSLQPSTERYRAAEGEPLLYRGRNVRRRVRWEALPVCEVSFEDIRAYVDWLASTGQVPGARLCTEVEWERAARGADGRRYPHGSRLEPDDANFDETYGWEPLGYGPDEVGSYPRSTSPFGVVDLAGNVWEAVRDLADGPALRGGSFYHTGFSALTTNHGQNEPKARRVWAGARVCATAPAP